MLNPMIRLCLVVVLGVSPVPAIPNLTAAIEEGPSGRLVTPTDEIIPGRWIESDSDLFRWQPQFIVDPVDYELKGMWRIELDARSGENGATGPFRAQLITGERVTGELTALDAGGIALSSARFGEVMIPIDHLVGVERILKSVTSGSGSQTQWVEMSPSGSTAWKKRLGSLQTDRAGAPIYRDLGLSESREIDLHLGLDPATPGFRVALGVVQNLEWINDGLLIESWGRRIVVLRELDETVEVQTLGTLPEDGRVQLKVSWDAKNEVAVVTFGRNVVRIAMPEGLDDGLLLESTHGRLSLLDFQCREPHGHDTLRSLEWSEIAEFEPETGTVRLIDHAEAQLDLTSIGDIRIGDDPGRSLNYPDDAGILVYHDGDRLFGTISKLTSRVVTITPDWASVAIHGRLNGLAELELPRSTRQRRSRSPARLSFAGGSSWGELVGWDPVRSTPLWSPQGSPTRSALTANLKGTIQLNSESEFFAGRRSAPHRIYLTNGDIIPGRVLSVAKGHVVLKSPLGATSTLSDSKIKAIELDPRLSAKHLHPKAEKPKRSDMWGEPVTKSDPRSVDQERRDRILSLPRKLKRKPPTHVMASKTGDLLRGRLLELQPQSVRFQTGTHEIRVPTEQILALIWLHPQPSAKSTPQPNSQPAAPPSARTDTTRAHEPVVIRVILSATARITVQPTEIRDGVIRGLSSLGQVIEIQYPSIESIVLNHAAPAHHYQSWLLKPMIEPFPDQ